MADFSMKYWLMLLVLLLLQYPSQVVGDAMFWMWVKHHNARCHALYMKSSSVRVVGFNRIAKALNAASANYGNITTILDNNLKHDVVPYCDDDLLFFIDPQSRFTIYTSPRRHDDENAAVTLFVPSDEAVRFEPWINLESQIVVAKADRKAFETASLSKGSILPTCSGIDAQVTEASVDGSVTVTISGAKITEWDIYNDGHVIVHGTNDFFQQNKGNVYFRRPPRMDMDKFEII